MEQANQINLKKSVGLLHSSGTTHFFDKKVYHVLLKHAYDDLLTEEVHFIDLKTLKSRIRFNSNNLQAIKESLSRLKSVSIEFDVLGQLTSYVKRKKIELQLGSWHTMTLLAEASIDNGIISYEFSSTMRRLLYEPELYELIDISIAHEFNSGYAYCLYELAVRAMKIGGTGWIGVDQFRKVMDVPPKVYERFNDLRKRVITVAQTEVNKLFEAGICPVKVEIQELRKGKAVAFVNVAIVDRREVKQLIPSSPVKSEFTEQQLQLILVLNENYKLHMKQAHLLVKAYSVEHIETILRRVDQARKSTRFNAGKLAGFVHSAIKGSIELPPSKSERDQRPSIQVNNDKRYQEYFSEYCERYLDTLDEQEQEALIDEILTSKVCNTASIVPLKVHGLAQEGREHVIMHLRKQPFIDRLIVSGLKKKEDFVVNVVE